MRERLGRHRRGLTLATALVAGVVLAACVPPPPPPGTFVGLGFDACSAPSSGTMSAWLNSPYRSVGIYIGGETRACSQPNLNAGWVSNVAGSGWHLIPIYVGLQDACNSGFGANIINFDTLTAFNQGVADSGSAANEASNLQLGPGNPVYLDLEAYPTGGFCSSSAMSYVNGWDQGLHARGYVAGVYSSAASGMVDLQHEIGAPGFLLPDAIWFAHWNGVPTVFGDPYINDAFWTNHQRLHQYQGGHLEVWGGVGIDIDNDAVAGPLAG